MQPHQEPHKKKSSKKPDSSPPEPKSIPAAARRALEEADNDVEKACELLEIEAADDEDLRWELMTMAVREAIASVMRDVREIIWKSTPEIDAAHKRANERAGARAVAVEHLLLDFWLPGGPLLRNASKEEVLAAAEMYTLKATDMSHKGRWLAAVGKLVPEGKLVGEVLTEKTLRNLQTKTEKSK